MIDFGCGTGVYSFYFSRFPGVHIWGLDIDKSRIEDCIEINRILGREALDFICSSGIQKTNQFQSDSIDVVLAIESLQYLPDVQAGFREIQQVLKPGGYLFGYFPILSKKSGHDTVLVNEENLSQFVQYAGLELVSITRMIGRTAECLIRLYTLSTRSRIITTLAYPLLLLLTTVCNLKAPYGSGCLVIAKKN